jgi:hypothetical protein
METTWLRQEVEKREYRHMLSTAGAIFYNARQIGQWLQIMKLDANALEAAIQDLEGIIREEAKRATPY